MSQGKILIGLIVDVSSSMKKNWGRKLKRRRVDLLKESLNQHFKKVKLSTNKSSQYIDVFCLGIGFKLPLKLISYDISEGKEAAIPESDDTTLIGIICDLISLSEIVPSQEGIKNIKSKLLVLWKNYADELLQDISFDDDLPELLRKHLNRELQNSLRSKMDQNSLFNRFQIFRFLDKYLNFMLKESKLTAIATRVTDKYIGSIMSSADSIFYEYAEPYENLIREEITEFADSEIFHILERSSIGFSEEIVIENFDKTKFKSLSSHIYTKIKHDFNKKYLLVWARNRASILASKYRLVSKLNTNELKVLTEKTIQSIGWKMLKPFVESVISKIFEESFIRQANKMVYTWVKRASEREVVRNVRDLTNLMPDTAEEKIYSDEYMFGGTPFYAALLRATQRFTDSKYKNYDKCLIVISDGEFDDYRPLELSTLLKSIGVTIITCGIHNKKVLPRISNKLSKTAGKGIRSLFEISSEVGDESKILSKIRQSEIETLSSNKLCIQLNHPTVLSSLLDAVIERE